MRAHARRFCVASGRGGSLTVTCTTLPPLPLPPTRALCHTHACARRYGSGGFAITSLVTAVSSQFVSQAWLDTTTQFWASNSPGGAGLEVLRAQESIGARMLWNQAEEAGGATCTWLAAQ